MGPTMKAEAKVAFGYILRSASSKSAPGSVRRCGAERPGTRSRTLLIGGSRQPAVACP